MYPLFFNFSATQNAMERRNYRPYLRQNGTDSVDKFLKNINSSNNHNERYTSKFPTDGLEGAGTSKYPSYSTYVGQYSPSLRNTASSSAAQGNYSTRYDVPNAERVCFFYLIYKIF